MLDEIEKEREKKSKNACMESKIILVFIILFLYIHKVNHRK